MKRDPRTEVDLALELFAHADAHCAAGRAWEAEPLAVRALEVFDRALPPDHQHIGAVLGMLGWIRLRLDSPAAARETFERLVQWQARHAELDPRARAGAWRNLAEARTRTRDGAGALAALRHALDALERARLGEGPDASEVHHALGEALRAELHLDDAERHLQRAVDLRERLGSAAALAASVARLASLIRFRGEPQRALPLYRRALALQERERGAVSAAAACALDNLALCLSECSQLREAIESTRRALQIYEREEGPDGENVSVCLANLAVMLEDAGDLLQAEQLCREALTRRRRAHGDDHVDVATALDNLSGILRRQGRTDSALEACRHAISIYERLLGPDHLDVAIALGNLAAILGDQGARAATRPYLERALAIQQRVYGRDHAKLAPLRARLAELDRPPIGGDDLTPRDGVAALPPTLTRETLFQLVAEEALRDGKVQQFELHLMQQLVEALGLDPIQAEARALEAKQRFHAGVLGEPRPLSRRALYRRALEVVVADGRVDDEERGLLRQLARLLGITQAVHGELSREVVQARKAN